MKTKEELDRMTPEERFEEYRKAARRARLLWMLTVVWTIAALVALVLVITHKL